MKKLIFLFYAVFFLIVFLLTVLFSLLNMDAVSVNFYFTTKMLPLSVLLAFEFLAGLSIGFLIKSVWWRMKYAKLQKTVLELQTALSQDS